MPPDLNEGDDVLISRLPLLLGRIKVNSIVVFDTFKYGILIKKVSMIDRQSGKFLFTGINQNSLTSEKIGLIQKKNILGSVLFHFKKKRHSI